MSSTPRISAIAALNTKKVIGKNNDLLWHISEDLKRFKKLTLHHAVIMGRNTWESLPASVRPLPERTNIVITKNPEYTASGAHIALSLEEGLEVAKQTEKEEVFIIGGAQIYSEALPFVNRLYLTLVDSDEEGDVYFPDYADFKTIVEKEDHPTFTWLTLEK